MKIESQIMDIEDQMKRDEQIMDKEGKSQIMDTEDQMKRDEQETEA